MRSSIASPKEMDSERRDRLVFRAFQAVPPFSCRKGTLMHDDHNVFVRAIKDKRKILLTYLRNGQQQTETKLVVPVYYGPETLESLSDSYHFWDALADNGEYMTTLSQSQIRRMELSEESFDPANL